MHQRLSVQADRTMCVTPALSGRLQAMLSFDPKQCPWTIYRGKQV